MFNYILRAGETDVFVSVCIVFVVFRVWLKKKIEKKKSIGELRAKIIKCLLEFRQSTDVENKAMMYTNVVKGVLLKLSKWS